MTKAVLFLALIVVGWSATSLLRQSKRPTPVGVSESPSDVITPIRSSGLVTPAPEAQGLTVVGRLMMVPMPNSEPDCYVVTTFPTGRTMLTYIKAEDCVREFASQK